MQASQNIQRRIHEIRGERIILDLDLAALYDVETRVLNQAVKRNLKRFPQDSMFQLTALEWQTLTSQIEMPSSKNNSSSQFVMMETPKNRTGKYLPYAFTEQGVAMLSGVLNSNNAINMNIAIMRTFIEVKKLVTQSNTFNAQLQQVRKELLERIGEHDTQLSSIYDVIEDLLDKTTTNEELQLQCKERERIGFKK